MSIPVELSDLQDNLDAAKLAIKDMGGDSGDTGYKGLADEINSIPAGGGTSGAAELAPIKSDYGVLFYYAEMETTYPVADQDGCTVEQINEVTLSNFLNDHPPYSDENIEFYYESGRAVWMYYGSMQAIEIPAADIEATTGIRVVIESNYAQFRITRVTAPKEGSLLKMAFLTQSDYANLSSNQSSPEYIIGGETITGAAVYRFDFGELPTAVDDNFLAYSRIQKVNFTYATRLTTIGTNFLAYSTLENCPIALPSRVTAIRDGFLRSCTKFNAAVYINNVISIGNNFMSYCREFNQPLTLNSNSVVIGTYFLASCYAFNSEILNTTSIRSIGDYFLYNCSVFNKPLDLRNVTSIGAQFLGASKNFNQPLDIRNVVTIGNFFLYEGNNPMAFSQPLDLSHVTSIGNGFLGNCRNFNYPLDLDHVETIGANFLKDCRSFNQPLDIYASNIGQSFLFYCTSFNSIVTFHTAPTAVINFNSWFYNCTSFNKPLDVTILTSTSAYPAKFNATGAGYPFYNMSNWTESLTIGSALTEAGSTTKPYGFIVNQATAPAYVNGLKIKGAGRASILRWFGGTPASGKYRNLIDGGAS